MGKEALIVMVHVDDLLVTGSNISLLEEFKREMSIKYEMSNLRKLSYYL